MNLKDRVNAESSLNSDNEYIKRLESENEKLKKDLSHAHLRIKNLNKELRIYSLVKDRHLNINKRILKFINQTSLAYIEWNNVFEVKRWNNSAGLIFGYSQEEARDKSFIDNIFEKEEKEKFLFHCEKLKRGEKSYSEMLTNITKDGSETECMWFNTVLEDENDNIVGVASLIKDITNEISEYRLLLGKEKHLRLLFDNMTNGFILQEMMVGINGEIIDFMYIEMNKAIQTLMGKEYKAYKFIGRTMKESFLNIDHKHFQKYREVALEGKSYRFEEYIERLDRVFEMYLYQPQHGQVATIINDITHIKESEKKITDQYLEIFEQHKILKENALELKKANDEINEQKKIIESKNKSITDSIQYARQIQSSLLPSKEFIEKLLPGSIVYYRPKDVVSGDFYWFSEIKDKIIMVIADCTGHGVPAALLSMIGVELLNGIINFNKITRPDLILNELRSQYNAKLSTNNDLLLTGMDLAICTFDTKSKMLYFAGANNPLIYIANNELTRIPGDRMTLCEDVSIGNGSFTLHKIKIKEPTSIYMFSDGYEDQIGGFKTSKFTRRRFEKLLTDIYSLPVPRQEYIMNLKLESWMEGFEQIDDVLVFGTTLK